jgi:hypothetical protein
MILLLIFIISYNYTQMVLCAGILCLMRRQVFRAQTTAVKFAGAVFGVASILFIVTLISAGWLTEKQVNNNRNK